MPLVTFTRLIRPRILFAIPPHHFKCACEPTHIALLNACASETTNGYPGVIHVTHIASRTAYYFKSGTISLSRYAIKAFRTNVFFFFRTRSNAVDGYFCDATAMTTVDTNCVAKLIVQVAEYK